MLSFPLQYGDPPNRRPPPRDQIGDAITHSADKGFLAWGAQQVKWRAPRQDIFPNIPTAHPPAPNNLGLRGVRLPDAESQAFATTYPSLSFEHHIEPAPAYWEFNMRH